MLFVLAQGAPPPVIDGRLADDEWSGATKHALSGGGELYLLTRREFLYVGVRGPAAGLASLCVGSGDTVRILHASAAVGEGTYAREAGGWARRTMFQWALRDSPRAGGPTDADRTAFLRSAGWVANASATGLAAREFQIRLADVETLGVSYLSTGEPMAVSYWPASMDDDCRSVRVPQGFLPERATFHPERWQRVDRK
jgi:hypothetical protein